MKGIARFLWGHEVLSGQWGERKTSRIATRIASDWLGHRQQGLPLIRVLLRNRNYSGDAKCIVIFQSVIFIPITMIQLYNSAFQSSDWVSLSEQKGSRLLFCYTILFIAHTAGKEFIMPGTMFHIANKLIPLAGANVTDGGHYNRFWGKSKFLAPESCYLFF